MDPSCEVEDEVMLTASMVSFMDHPLLRHPENLFHENALNLHDPCLSVELLKLLKIVGRIKEGFQFQVKGGQHQRFDIAEVKKGINTINILRDDYIWEHLNVGHWKTVECGWRRTYTFLCILKVGRIRFFKREYYYYFQNIIFQMFFRPFSWLWPKSVQKKSFVSATWGY